MKTKLFLVFSVIAISITGAGFKFFQQSKPWPVPDKNAKMVNPVASNVTSIAAGKALWSKHCQSCHGKTGMGDGTKSAELKTQPEDMTKAVVQNQSDGALFYKTSEGRDDMPNFKKKIPDQEDIWSIIDYIRTFKK